MSDPICDRVLAMLHEPATVYDLYRTMKAQPGERVALQTLYRKAEDLLLQGKIVHVGSRGIAPVYQAAREGQHHE